MYTITNRGSHEFCKRAQENSNQASHSASAAMAIIAFAAAVEEERVYFWPQRQNLCTMNTEKLYE